jgi:DNA-binding NtrC family response regulator
MGKNAAVLVIDDDDLLCEMLLDLLTEAGYTVETAHNQVEALAAMKRSSFDVVLTDLNLGGESGLDVVELVVERLPRTAVILMSALTTPEVEEKAQRAGAFGTLRKPFGIGEVLGLLQEASAHATTHSHP